MTEDQLLRMIALGALRLRLNAGAKWFCAGVVVAAAISAAGVLVLRLRPELTSMAVVVVWCVPVLVGAVAVIGVLHCRPSLEDVAGRLDRSARLQEHLTTWIEQRKRPASEDPIVRCFVVLQKNATLRLAGVLRPWRQLPLRLPGWSRVFWLVLLALGCAVLMPEQRPEAGRVSGARIHAETSSGGAAARARRLAPADLGDSLRRVEILPPSDRHKYMALAFGPDVPAVLKADALRELEAKLGTLPEADLNADVRELLGELRRQVRGSDAGQAAAGTAAEVTGGRPDAGPRTEAGAQNPPEPQELILIARTRFQDVAEPLARYYQSKTGESR